MIKAETRNPLRTWAFFVGAGDANRTRAVQLGNCNDWPLVTSGAQVTALVDESVRDRDWPLVTLANVPHQSRDLGGS